MNTLLLKEPSDWNSVTKSLKALSRGQAKDIRYIRELSESSHDQTVVDVVVKRVRGDADYLLEVHGKDVMSLPDDTVGMHVAVSAGLPVLVADLNGWWLLSPDGKIEAIILEVFEDGDLSTVTIISN